MFTTTIVSEKYVSSELSSSTTRKQHAWEKAKNSHRQRCSTCDWGKIMQWFTMDHQLFYASFKCKTLYMYQTGSWHSLWHTKIRFRALVTKGLFCLWQISRITFFSPVTVLLKHWEILKLHFWPSTGCGLQHGCLSKLLIRGTPLLSSQSRLHTVVSRQNKWIGAFKHNMKGSLFMSCSCVNRC